MPARRLPSWASVTGGVSNGAACISTASRTLASLFGSPPSCASAQTRVASASPRQPMSRTPVTSASLPVGRPSTSGRTATVCTSLPLARSITSMRRGKLLTGTT
jgi:hypothetical protein